MLLVCLPCARARSDVLRSAKHGSFEAMKTEPQDMARHAEWIRSRGWMKYSDEEGERGGVHAV